MPRLTDKQHLIRLIDKETKKRGRGVTFAQLCAASRRDREDLRVAAEELIEDDIVELKSTPPGSRGRPSTYLVLKFKWVEPEPSLDPVQPLVPTQEPTEHEIVKYEDGSFDAVPPDVDPFVLVGPQWVKLISSQTNGELNPKKTLDIIQDFAKKYDITPAESTIIWNRLKNPEYDEYWTNYGISRIVKKRSDGTRDLRYGDEGTVYAIRHDSPPDLKLKKERQELAQQQRVNGRLERGWSKTEEEAREFLQLPEPSNDLPDMTAFVRYLKAIM